jgi:hypothetical protein
VHATDQDGIMQVTLCARLALVLGLKAFTKTCNNAGYRPTSATPWTEPDLLVVLTHLDSVIHTSVGFIRLLLLRDGYCLSVMWQTLSRGDNAVDWRLDNIRLPTGGTSRQSQ